MSVVRNLTILRAVLFAAEEQTRDRRIRTRAEKKDRLVTLARMYGESQKVSKKEVESILRARVLDVVLGV